MHATTLRRLTALGMTLLAAPWAGASEVATAHATRKLTDADLIKSALSAAPAAIAENASVVTMDGDGSMRTLRRGRNGFTCVPGDPAIPGPSAMCADAAGMSWMHAWMEKKAPAPRVGLAYMLAGGTDASNTDAFALTPPKGATWVKTGPHVMILGADKAFYEQYPKGADPDTSVPYVMWAGTPYEHLMAPTQ